MDHPRLRTSDCRVPGYRHAEAIGLAHVPCAFAVGRRNRLADGRLACGRKRFPQGSPAGGGARFRARLSRTSGRVCKYVVAGGRAVPGYRGGLPVRARHSPGGTRSANRSGLRGKPTPRTGCRGDAGGRSRQGAATGCPYRRPLLRAVRKDQSADQPARMCM